MVSFKTADRVLHFAGNPLSLAIGFQLLIAKNLHGNLFQRTLRLLGRTSPNVHSDERGDDERPSQENVVKTALLAFLVVPLLTVPAFAGSLSAGDKPMIVAEDVGVEVGNVVGVGVGERHRHRDHGDLNRSHGDLYMFTRHRHHREDRHDDRYDDRR